MGGDDNAAVCCEQAQGRRAAFLGALPKALPDKGGRIDCRQRGDATCTPTRGCSAAVSAGGGDINATRSGRRDQLHAWPPEPTPANRAPRNPGLKEVGGYARFVHLLQPASRAADAGHRLGQVWWRGSSSRFKADPCADFISFSLRTVYSCRWVPSLRRVDLGGFIAAWGFGHHSSDARWRGTRYRPCNGCNGQSRRVLSRTSTRRSGHAFLIKTPHRLRSERPMSRIA